MKQKTQPTEQLATAAALPILSLADRIKISDNIRRIASRTTALNPVYPDCMFSVVSFLDMGELVLAIEFFFQQICNPDDWLVDVSLHDLIYMLHVSPLLGGPLYNLKTFGFLDDYVSDLYD